jgi:hypothetical protein
MPWTGRGRVPPPTLRTAWPGCAHILVDAGTVAHLATSREVKGLFMKVGPIAKSRLAKTDQELRDLAASDADWFVRTADDMRQLREVGDNAFAKLPENEFLAFLASLRFENGGVASGCYKPLMYTLTLSEIFEVFAHFGMSMELFTSEENDSCLECKCPNCDFSFWDFCSSLCSAKTE